MEKKVGLITIHAINNFGSLLQAYATQKFIMNLGYKCDIINKQEVFSCISSILF